MSKTGLNRKNMTKGFVLFSIIALSIGFGTVQAPARFWSDPATGLAIGGYDPLAYYTGGKERLGREEYEVSWKGQVWRFANEGNKAAFIAAPETYVPKFDGYGLVSVSRGLPAIGNPLIWVIHENALYFFHSNALRTIWEEDKKQFLALARSKWPEVNIQTLE
jgi:YHS domain-containing protein